MAEHVWYCKIGGEIPDEVWEIDGEYAANDQDMRPIVKKAYERRFGVEPEFVFSGWGQTLTESERAAAENRPPNHDDQVSEVARSLSFAYFTSLRKICEDESNGYELVGSAGSDPFERDASNPHREALIEAVKYVLAQGKIDLP